MNTKTYYINKTQAELTDGAFEFVQQFERNTRGVQFVVSKGDQVALFEFATSRNAASLAEVCGARVSDHGFELDVTLELDALHDVREVLAVLALFVEMGGDASMVPADFLLRHDLFELKRAATRDGVTLSIWEVKAIDALCLAFTSAHKEAA